jgi:mono/diheme cytochrome c family protein
MPIRSTTAGSITLGLVCGAVMASCTAPGGPDSIKGTEFPGSTAVKVPADAGIVQVTTSPLVCMPVSSSTPLPARSTLTAGTVAASPTLYFTSDLFNLFKTVCGGCHVESNLGNPPFVVSANTFSMVVDQTVVDRITSDDPTQEMPPPAPGATPYSKRPDTDPTHQLATLLETWIMAGRPTGSFDIDADPSSASATADYSLTPDLGGSLTNIGSCVPGGTIGQNQKTMDQLDAMFAMATGLPDTLAETDLTTLDSMTLAQNGVVSYAPTYPLYSDGSGKMRYVRAPRGKSISFDKATQTFQIPDNTRFYKTFLKEVVDGNGNMTWRKIETRLIVARADTDPPAGTSGETKQNALFGSYIWSDDETSATLLKDPLRDGTLFADRMLTYFTDEQKAQGIIDSAPMDLESELEAVPGLVRHYAVPGRDRCIDCHMGSPSADFVLGFTPLQVNRVPNGTPGLYEPASGDELTQVQRLIDYGVITGMTSPADVLPLDKSEGTRAPRNDYELAAQAYMTGNCAHCHNPRGFPTQKAPALKDVLNFLPSADGGVFQFPLDRTSPVRERGPTQSIPIPYITPSLYDYPSQASGQFYTPKYVVCQDNPNIELCKSNANVFMAAPWRSLIYRNVDTPFDYVDDSTIFPHMPMNSAGYDCRVAHIMGDWMTSIPAKLATPNAVEAAARDRSGSYPTNVDTDPQPYVEVTPSDPDYEAAIRSASDRVMAYHAGHRYDFCPDTTDILDPFIVDELANNFALTIDSPDIYDPVNPLDILWPSIGVPVKPHWVVTDTTDPPPPWNPRRPDWADALLSGNPGDTSLLQPDDATALENVVASLQTAKLTSDIKTVLTTPVAFGVWKQKAGCKFTGIPTAGSFQGDARPRWMDVAQVDPAAPVYQQVPGAAVFTTICFNCHGPLANAQGLLADEIGLLTGGDARVANFRDGLLGPTTAPGMNRQAIFIDPAGVLTADDITARYVAWMALGGTLKHLPSQLLDLVSNTPVQGLFRNTSYINPLGTPDMLRLGLELCSDILPANNNVEVINLGGLFTNGRIDWSGQTPLIDHNGDAELWLKLCALGNRQVVRVPLVAWSDSTTVNDLVVQATGGSLYWADAYPSTAPVMNDRGAVVSGVSEDNLFPLCVRKPTDSGQMASADAFLKAHPIGAAGATIPYCPQEIFETDPANGNAEKWALKFTVDAATSAYDFVDGKQWAARGAINAGMAVFVYLDQVERGAIKIQPTYDQCDLLATSTSP